MGHSNLTWPGPRPFAKPSEEGYLLLAVMFLMALLVLSLAAAAPRVAKSIQRDRDVETMQRGKQYIRAVQLYYRKFHAYPPNEDALVKTNDIRFLRKRYLDPITGKDDWKPIMFGQNKTPTAMGFFGQPLTTGGAIAGIGPSGGNTAANSPNGMGGLFNSSPAIGSGPSPGSGGLFAPSGPGIASPTAPGDTSGAAASGAGSTTGATSNGTDSSGAANSGTGQSGQTGSAGQTGFGGQTFGGAGIIGFEPGSPKQSILVYKKKDHYNEWEFTYDPIMDMKMLTGGNTGAIGQPAGSTPGAVGIPGITTTGTDTNSTPGSLPAPPPGTPAPQQ
ncbi:MAG TPA: type II secretion system protein [Terracidiphilus sp.]|jgi:type II secretory pathway pseudopilin PulG